MKKYRVEVSYQTKRGGVRVGMTVEAKDARQAEQIAERKVLKAYPARKWVMTTVEEARP